MTYAKRILSILLVLCLLGNTAITVFASDTDGGGEELPPVDAATEEPAPEDPPPEQGEEPPSEPSDEEDPTAPEESTPPEDAEETQPTEEETPPPESSDEEAAPEEPTEDTPPEESPEDEEEATEPPLEEVPTEEIVGIDDGEMSAEITAANDIVLPKGVTGKLEHCGNAILTDGVAGGTVRLTYESYLAGAEVTAYFSFVEEKRLNGVVAYCIEPEVAALDKTYTEAEQTDAWLKMPPEMREAIVLTMAYGYPQVEYSADPNDIYYKQTGSSNKQNMLNGENYIATQLIIWEFLCGRRSYYAPYALTDASLRNVCDGGWATIRTTYDAIVAKLANHNSIPAYASGSKGAYVYELKYNKGTGTYRYMLPAERQSTKRNCDIQLPTGVSYLYASDGATVIGFEATVAAAESLLKNGFTASGETPFVSVDPNNAVVCWKCSGSQTVVTTMETKPDPAKAYFTLKLAAAGSLVGTKTSPNNDVEGYCFKFYSWAADRSWFAKTDANGNLCLSDSNYSTLGTTQITGLPDGQYSMLEVLSQKGKDLVYPDSWTITVSDANGKVTSITTFTPESMRVITYDVNGNVVSDKTVTDKHMTTDANGDCRIQEAMITGLSGGGTVTMTINNAPNTLEIYKTSQDGKIEGITFHVLDANNKEVGSDTTDANGKIEIEGLVAGQTYTVHEDARRATFAPCPAGIKKAETRSWASA